MLSVSTNIKSNLFDTVVNGGYCVGCGTCALINEDVKIELDSFGKYSANLSELPNAIIEEKMAAVCPFSENSMNEDEIAKEIYSDYKNIEYDRHIGYFLDTYAGFINEGDFRKKGSSGGMGSWILYELFSKGLIDGVIHVKEAIDKEKNSPLFNFDISRSFDEIKRGAKSRYYPVEMTGVLKEIKKQEGRYAIIGVSCFIKSIRLLSKADPVINERIKFTIGLICGHEKSKRFAEMIAWQCGVHPDNLESIDFRKKLPNRKSSDYGVEVTGYINGSSTKIVKPMKEIIGSNWGHGFFKYKACDYCDDVMNETADLTIGDAWLPEYSDDYLGTNVVVVRNPIINTLITEAMDEKRITLESISVNRVVQSQASSYRHRREEIGFRLENDDRAGIWRPKKRLFTSTSPLTDTRKKIQESRITIQNESHILFNEALKTNNLNTFNKKMRALIAKYDNLYDNDVGKPLWKKLIIRFVRKFGLKSKVKRIIKIFKNSTT